MAEHGSLVFYLNYKLNYIHSLVDKYIHRTKYEIPGKNIPKECFPEKHEASTFFYTLPENAFIST